MKDFQNRCSRGFLREQGKVSDFEENLTLLVERYFLTDFYLFFQCG